VFAQIGARTLLIDADMRAARQHTVFKLPNQGGLSALLAGRVRGTGIERIAGFASLSVIPGGPVPPNPLELVSRPEFAELVTRASEDYEVVLIDTPAGEPSADAQAIAARAAGALVVVREGRSRLEGLGRLSAAMRGARAEVVGCVLNRH
jgi:protein-tyrosine kinase